MRSLIGLAHGRGGHTAPVNLIQNGSFVSHIDGWYQGDSQSALTFASGQLQVAMGAGAEVDTSSLIIYRPHGDYAIPIGSLTTLDVIGHAKSAEVGAKSHFRLWFYTDPYGVSNATMIPVPSDPGADIGITLTEFGTRGVSVPVGSTHLQIQLMGPHGITYDDLYVGGPGGDAPPYADVALPLGERIPNGAFESDIADWSAWNGSETLAHETGSPITGTGSLSVTTPGSSSHEGVYVSANPVAVPGESLRCRLKLKGAGNVKAVFAPIFGDDILLFTGALSGTPTVIDEIVEFPETIPNPFDVGIVLCDTFSIAVLTNSTQAVTFFVDDVSVTAAP